MRTQAGWAEREAFPKQTQGYSGILEWTLMGVSSEQGPSPLAHRPSVPIGHQEAEKYPWVRLHLRPGNATVQIYEQALKI